MSTTPTEPPSELDQVRSLVGTNSRDDQALLADLATADHLVARYVDDHGIADDLPPTELVAQARVKVAADLFNRRKAQNGVILQQFATGDGGTAATPIRIARDPIAAARDLLGPWMLEVSIG